jgi:hypothetical protein
MRRCGPLHSATRRTMPYPLPDSTNAHASPMCAAGRDTEQTVAPEGRPRLWRWEAALPAPSNTEGRTATRFETTNRSSSCLSGEHGTGAAQPRTLP